MSQFFDLERSCLSGLLDSLTLAYFMVFSTAGRKAGHRKADLNLRKRYAFFAHPSKNKISHNGC